MEVVTPNTVTKSDSAQVGSGGVVFTPALQGAGVKTALWLVVLAATVALNPFIEGWINPYWFTILMLTGINIVLAVSLNLVNGFTGQFSIGHAGFMAVGAYVSAVVTMNLGTTTA